MKSIKVIVIGLAAAAAGCVGRNAEPAYRIDPAKSAIVSAGRPTEKAAKELQTHFERITGVTVPIVAKAEQAPAGSYLWLPGVAPDGEKPVAEMRPEETRYRITADKAYFWGPARAPEMAVYRFLERALGVRWPWAGAISCDASKTIDVRDTEDTWIPELKMRGVRGSGLPFVEWRFRLLSGGHDSPNYGHAFTKYWGRFGATKLHPEYFAMRRDGQRIPMGVEPDTAFNIAASTSRPAQFISLCPSCRTLEDQIIADWKEKDFWKRQRCVNICENDATGDNVCHCEACKALDEPPPADAKDWWECWYADRYVNLAKRVLAKAKETRPDAEVCMYAYNATEQAPRREKLTDDIIVGLVPTYFSRESISEYYRRWKEAGMKKHFYRPNRRCYYAAPYLPLGYERQFYDIFELINSYGSMGCSEDGAAPASQLGWFSDYVILKAMSEPERPFEYWEDHYMAAFGAAKDDVKAYYRYWREEVWEKRIAPDVDYLTEIGLCFNFTRGLYFNLEKYFTDDDFVKSGCLLHRALAHEDLDANRRALIEQLMTAHEHSRLWAAACCTMTEDAAKALLDYRRNRGLNLFQYGETYFGDVCATGRADDDSTARRDAPATECVVVDAYGFSAEAAELKRHLDVLGGCDVPLVKDESLVPTNAFAFYVGRVPHGNDAKSVIDAMPERYGVWTISRTDTKGRRGGIYLYGKKGGVRSAVNELLENELWVRWPWGGEIAAKPKADGHIKVYDKAGSWKPNPRFGRRSFKMPGKDSATFLARMNLAPEDAAKPLSGGEVFRLHLAFDGRLHGDEEKTFDAVLAAFNRGVRDFEITADEPKTPYDWYRAYMVAKALEDPLKPYTFWVKRYFQSYGAAAGEMRAFFKSGAATDKAAALAKKTLLPADRARIEAVK